MTKKKYSLLKLFFSVEKQYKMKKTKIYNLKIIREKSRELLLSHENHLNFVFAIVLFGVSLILPFMAYALYYNAMGKVVSLVILILTEILLALPVLSGVYKIIGKALNKREWGLSEVFFAFSSTRNYFKTLLLSLFTIIKYITPISCGIIAGSVSDAILRRLNILYGVVAVAKLSVAFLTILLFLPLVNRFYAVSYLVLSEDMSIVKSIGTSWRATKGKTLKLISVSISFVPVALVSVAALCVPMVVYTAPYLICVYSLISMKTVWEYKIEMKKDVCPSEQA